MGAYDDVRKQADELIDKAKGAVGDIADTSADKMAGAVDKVTDLIDDKTGGRASAATAMLDQTVTGALDKLGSATPKVTSPKKDES